MIKNLTIVILLVSLIASCAYKSDNYAGKVNDILISNQQYISAWRNEFESFRLRNGYNPNEQEMELIKESAWNKLIEGLIVQQEIHKRGITVSFQEAIDSLTTNIPDIIMDNDIFLTPEGFDFQSYRQSLLTAEPVDLSWLVSHYVNAYIPIRKLEQILIEEHRFTTNQIRNEYRIRHSSADISIIDLPRDKFEAVISETDIYRFYNENRDMFTIEPSAVLSFVVFPLEPSRQDSLNAKKLINEIYDSLVFGENFNALVAKHSQSRTAARRGETEFIELSKLPEGLQRELDLIDSTGFTKPHFVNGKWNIYQPVTRTRNLVKLREIVVFPTVSQETEEYLLDKILNFRELALEITLERAAYEYEMDFYVTDTLSVRNSTIEGLGRSDRIVERAIQSEPGTVFEPRPHNNIPILDGKKGFVLISVRESQNLSYEPIHKVRGKIESILSDQRKMEYARLAAEDLYINYTYQELKEKEMRFDMLKLKNFSYNSKVFSEYNETLNRKVLLSQNQELVLSPFELDMRVIIVMIDRFYQAEMNKFQDYSTHIAQIMKDDMVGNFFQGWLEEQIKKARIRDWRS